MMVFFSLSSPACPKVARETSDLRINYTLAFTFTFKKFITLFFIILAAATLRAAAPAHEIDITALIDQHGSSVEQTIDEQSLAQHLDDEKLRRQVMQLLIDVELGALDQHDFTDRLVALVDQYKKRPSSVVRSNGPSTALVLGLFVAAVLLVGTVWWLLDRKLSAAEQRNDEKFGDLVLAVDRLSTKIGLAERSITQAIEEHEAEEGARFEQDFRSGTSAAPIRSDLAALMEAVTVLAQGQEAIIARINALSAQPAESHSMLERLGIRRSTTPNHA
jgi:hypothetical protein